MIIIEEIKNGRLEDEIFKLNSEGYTVVKTEYAKGQYIVTAEKVISIAAYDKILKNPINNTPPKRKSFEFLTKLLNRKSKGV